ncbi:MAG: serine/threonine protein kinase, partial [Deltaproteobacteria bacterium]|nr:serine/threonine protein kinase [Kofleriaceae bacterium]
MSRPGASSDDDVGVEVGSVLLGKYRIEAILGKGGMGIVARATHLHLDEQVAIKFLRRDTASDPEAAQRFLREAQAAVKLKNEHVARVIDVGTLDGHVPYMVMEYLEGADLDLMLEQSGVIAPELAVDFVLQACAALSEAHALGIVHRDIKPSNIFVTWRTDGSVLVKVLDFGISKIAAGLTEVSLTQTQSVLGTPAYMSPEQMRSARSVDARTDIWSLGTVLYELVQGHRPFEAESFSEMCVKVAVDPPMPLTNPLPPGLADVIMTCLAKSPAERYPNVGALAEALVPFGRDPRAAQLLMERTQRTVGRAPTPPPV